jgi:TPR repeat protein
MLTTLLLFILLICTQSALADYSKGSDAFQKGDYTTAVIEWRPLADKGDAYAQYNLGFMYSNGKGVIQNHKTAVKYYTLAAEQGHANAQFNLGNMYSKGNGVIQNYTRAHMWYNISTSQGYELALKNRDLIAKKMTTSQLEKAQTLASGCVEKNYKGC